MISDQVDLTLRMGLSFCDNKSQKEREISEAKDFYSTLQEQESAQPNMDSINIFDQQSWSSSTYRSKSINRNIQATLQPIPYMSTQANKYLFGNALHGKPIIPRRRRSKLNILQSLHAYIRTCNGCGTNRTPLWRKGTNGPQTLCNACGLRYAREVKKSAQVGRAI